MRINTKRRNLYREFQITSVCKADILNQFRGSPTATYRKIKQRVTKMTTAEMKELASRMSEAYVSDSFWSDLDVIFMEKYFKVRA